MHRVGTRSCRSGWRRWSSRRRASRRSRLTGDRVIPAAFGRMLGDRLKHARYVELAGDDHFSWVSPNVDQQIDLIFEFTGVRGSGQRVSSVWQPWSVLTPSERPWGLPSAA